MQDQESLGKKFLELSAINAYGIWIIICLFPIILAGAISFIDESRSLSALMLSAIAIGIIAASYIFRFYLVRNTESLRSKVLKSEGRDKTLKIISGGFWWWLITLIFAITAVIASRGLF